MPDFNPFKADIPVIRPEIINPGLSLIVQPRYDYKTSFPPSVNIDTDGDPEAYSGLLPDEDAARKRRQRLLGQVSVAPAATTDYKTARRYNRADLGFMPGRDNEDLYAQNQGFFASVGNGLGRLVPLTLTKLGTGVGYLGGLVGMGNESEKYGGGFSGWIAGASDNGMAKWFQSIEDDKIKADWFPIYKKASESQHGFFRHMGDLSFWTDDLTDGIAFMASAFVPGMSVSKLNLGAKTLRGLAALRGIGYAEEAAALARVGATGTAETEAVAQAMGYGERTAGTLRGAEAGTVESQALTREGLGAQIETPTTGELGGTTFETPNATREIPRVLKWIDNAKAARSIDVATTSIVNTASESMFEANDAKNQTYDTLMKQKNSDGSNKYTVEQAKQIAAKVAKDSYLMNLGALSLSNLWEANLLFKRSKVASRLAGKFEVNGLMGDVALAKKTFGQRAISGLGEAAKGILAEGLWEENIQLAIQRLNTNPDNFDLDFGERMKSLSKQYINQTKGAILGQDSEAAQNIGVGGLLGAIGGKVFGSNTAKETQKSLANLNAQMTAFKTLGNVYKTNEDGSIDLSNGTPQLDEDKVKSWVASLNNVLSLQQVAKNFENRGMKELSQIYQDEVFARFAKAHFDNGLGDVLRQKLSDVANIKQEDLALLGYDPSSKNNETSTLLNQYTDKANVLESLYDNIQGNAIPTGINMNTKEGREKYYKMTDKMFYLSARSASLKNRIQEATQQYENVKANADTFDAAFNSLSDETVTRYNELYEQLRSAQKQSDNDQVQQDYINELNQRVNSTKGGVSVTNAPSRLERIRRNNPSAYVQLPENIRERNTSNIAEKQKALDEFVNQNKDVLNKLKKDSKGRYMYEIANKNYLPSAKEMERQQIIQAELTLANNATVNVLSRLADPKYGVKYWDEVYSGELERHAAAHDVYEDITADDRSKEEQEYEQRQAFNLPEEKRKRGFNKLNRDEAYAQWSNLGDQGTAEDRQAFEDQIQDSLKRLGQIRDAAGNLSDADIEDEIDRTKALRAFGKKNALQAIKEEFNLDENRDLNDVDDELTDTQRQRDFLDQKDDRTPEEENQLQQLNNKVDELEKQRETSFETLRNNDVIDQNPAVKPEDKSLYKKVLNQIAKIKKSVTKYDDYYEVNGEQYRKVTDLIGDSIPPELRQEAGTQAATNAGNTIDTIVKAYFAGTHNNTDFKFSMSDKISQEAYDNVIKSLDKIKTQLANKGIQIVASNVFVVDDNMKVAGEIDLLGIDKDGNFKVYEIQARRADVYRQYGKRGLGIKIRDIDGKRLSMYRNMFANQYGVIPDEISVKFPFQVKYDKTNAKGFIEDTKVREPIRFQPLKNVQIKMNAQEPLKIGSKYNSIDMTKIFLDTFLPEQIMRDKLAFLFRNLKFDQVLKGMVMTVKPAETKFMQRFVEQRAALAGQGQFQIKKFRDFRNRDEFGNPREFDNLYSLYGNTEISLSYEGTPIGFFSPVETLAYKDAAGQFHILDETTDPQTYADVTGNSLESYPEFRKVAAAYKKLHTELTSRMLQNGGKELTLSGDDLKEIADFKMSYGELDLLKRNQKRPDLSKLAMPGVKIGSKMVPTIVNIDENGAVKVVMEKGRAGKATILKYQQIDKWANQNIDDIMKAITDRDGERATNDIAVIETPNGEFRIVSVKAKEGFDAATAGEFVENLGSKFTAATSEKVFKNEGIMIVPKTAEQTATIGLNEQNIVSKVYAGNDIDTLEKHGTNAQSTTDSTVETAVTNFLANLSDKDRATLEEFDLTTKEDIINDYVNGDWSSIEEYLENIKNCK